MNKKIKDLIMMLIGSIIYALGTHFFIFASDLFLGGTTGVAVIMNFFLESSSSNIFTVINLLLLLIAFLILGKDMAVKTFVGSTLTTLFIALLDIIAPTPASLFKLPILTAIVGAAIIAVASTILFSVSSSSGGTDIIALIVKKFVNVNIGLALLISDLLIVIIGGLCSDIPIAIASFIGLLVKTLGIAALTTALERIKKTKKTA